MNHYNITNIYEYYLKYKLYIYLVLILLLIITLYLLKNNYNNKIYNIRLNSNKVKII
jgi:hypothetical protein